MSQRRRRRGNAVLEDSNGGVHLRKVLRLGTTHDDASDASCGQLLMLACLQRDHPGMGAEPAANSSTLMAPPCFGLRSAKDTQVGLRELLAGGGSEKPTWTHPASAVGGSTCSEPALPAAEKACEHAAACAFAETEGPGSHGSKNEMQTPQLPAFCWEDLELDKDDMDDNESSDDDFEGVQELLLCRPVDLFT